MAVALLASACQSVSTVANGPLAINDLHNPATSNDESVSVRFFGVSSLLFDDGETRVLVDGFFTRPDWRQWLLNTPVTPDIGILDNGEKGIELPELDGVVVTHAHFDHVMDAGVLLHRFSKARFCGSPASINAALSAFDAAAHQRVRDERMLAVSHGTVCQIGDFKIHFLESMHFDIWSLRNRTPQSTLDAPLRMPASLSAYETDRTYSLFIEHRRGGALVHPSAGMPRVDDSDLQLLLDQAGTLPRVVFLGINTPLKNDTDYLTEFWRRTVQPVDPEVVIPIHWDNPFKSLHSNSLKLPLRVLSDIQSNVEHLRTLAARDKIRFEFLMLDAKVYLF